MQRRGLYTGGSLRQFALSPSPAHLAISTRRLHFLSKLAAVLNSYNVAKETGGMHKLWSPALCEPIYVPRLNRKGSTFPTTLGDVFSAVSM